MSTTYAVDVDGAAQAGRRFRELAQPCKQVARELESAGIRAVGPVTIASEVAALLAVSDEATSTLGAALDYLGSGVLAAAGGYQETDAEASHNFALTRRHVRGI